MIDHTFPTLLVAHRCILYLVVGYHHLPHAHHSSRPNPCHQHFHFHVCYNHHSYDNIYLSSIIYHTFPTLLVAHRCILYLVVGYHHLPHAHHSSRPNPCHQHFHFHVCYNH